MGPPGEPGHRIGADYHCLDGPFAIGHCNPLVLHAYATRPLHLPGRLRLPVVGVGVEAPDEAVNLEAADSGVEVGLGVVPADVPVRRHVQPRPGLVLEDLDGDLLLELPKLILADSPNLVLRYRASQAGRPASRPDLRVAAYYRSLQTVSSLRARPSDPARQLDPEMPSHHSNGRRHHLQKGEGRASPSPSE